MILIFRKLYRLTGLVFPLIYFFSDKHTALFWLSLVTSLFLILDILRFFLPQFNHQIFKTFKPILKEEESRKKISGSSYFLAGSLLTVVLFVRPVAIAALLFLIFGDALSALIGTKWGRTKIGQKSLEGSLAFFAGCLLIAVILQYTYLGLDIKVAFFGGLAATLVELIPSVIDDNLGIPLCSGLVMALMH